MQAQIESSLKQLTGKPVEIVGSGRTDSGVHAKQQFFHVDLGEVARISTFMHQLNGILPTDIAIINMNPVSEQAHARFDATCRSYQYHISHVKNPFLQDRSYYLTRRPDMQLMGQGCKMLLEQKDFQCFSKVRTAVKNFECQVNEAKWEYIDNDLLIFYVSANRFLRGMVRAMVGTLLELGLQKIDLVQFRKILDSKDRSAAGPSVPAHGLFLTKVEYPNIIMKS